MGELEKIYKDYACQLPFDKSRNNLTAIGKLIISSAQNDDDSDLWRTIVCTDLADKQKHTYFYRVMSDDFKNTVPKNFDTYDFFSHRYTLRGQCHSVTAAYLKKYRNSSIKAITSLCYGDNSYFLHSYIWDEENNIVFDFSKNIIMDKDQYDELFVYKEINVLSYDEYDAELIYYEYMLCGKDYCRLVYLAAHRLYEELYGVEYVAPADLNPFKVLGRVLNRN